MQTFVNRLGECLSVPLNVSLAGGCGCKMTRVLSGEADFYPFPGFGTSKWDVCAGDAIITAAGGSVVDRLGNRITYDPHATSFDQLNGLLACRDASFNAFACTQIAALIDYLREPHGAFITSEWVRTALAGLTLRGGFRTP